MLNLLTIDVEDYYQVSAFESSVPFEKWPEYETRVVGNTCRLLEILSFYRVRATFFVLGWIAERRPYLVQMIAREGHEIASHGYRHRRIYHMTPDEFREDVRRSKSILEGIVGVPVTGFRAPSYSIVEKTVWALDILQEEGFAYDSSIFPIQHDLYGMPGAARFSYKHALSEGRSILEIPLSTVRIAGQNLPVAGGGYFRIFPYSYIRWGLERINKQEAQPAIFYLHPWEIDPKQPRLSGSLLSRFRHYTNLEKTEERFKRLLRDFKFCPVRDFIQKTQPATDAPTPQRLEVADVVPC
jgi:polysaccharide deacetylase family protein (PEP-CTERM system associated)